MPSAEPRRTCGTWISASEGGRRRRHGSFGLIGTDAVRLADEVTAIPRGLPPDVAYSRATSARHLAAALVGSVGELAALGIKEQFTLGKAIQYTQALGQARAAVRTAQQLASSLATSDSVDSDLGALSTVAGQVTSAVTKLDRLVGR
jgi:hypothetical protein